MEVNDPLPSILDEPEAIAEYDGPWLKLRTRIKELREREARLEDVLVSLDPQFSFGNAIRPNALLFGGGH